MSHWKNQDDLAESTKLSFEVQRLEREMRDKRSEIAADYQAKIDAINEKRLALAEKNI